MCYAVATPVCLAAGEFSTQCIVRKGCVGPCVFGSYRNGHASCVPPEGCVFFRFGRVKDSPGESSCSQSYDGHGGLRLIAGPLWRLGGINIWR